jgi:hypothetical protein
VPSLSTPIGDVTMACGGLPSRDREVTLKGQELTDEQVATLAYLPF